MPSISLTEKDNQTTIKVRVADVIIITLAENPVTGFRWQVSKGQDKIVTLISEDFELPSNAKPGAGGIKTISLKVVNSKGGAVIIQNCKPWSGDVHQIFTVTLQGN